LSEASNKTNTSKAAVLGSSYSSSRPTPAALEAYPNVRSLVWVINKPKVSLSV